MRRTICIVLSIVAIVYTALLLGYLLYIRLAPQPALSAVTKEFTMSIPILISAVVYLALGLPMLLL